MVSPIPMLENVNKTLIFSLNARLIKKKSMQGFKNLLLCGDVILYSYCFRNGRRFGTTKPVKSSANVCTCPKSGSDV